MNNLPPVVDSQDTPRLVARVEEQYDQTGDLVWALTLLATTYNRATLDRIAEALGCELEFMPSERAS